MNRIGASAVVEFDGGTHPVAINLCAGGQATNAHRHRVGLQAALSVAKSHRYPGNQSQVGVSAGINKGPCGEIEPPIHCRDCHPFYGVTRPFSRSHACVQHDVNTMRSKQPVQRHFEPFWIQQYNPVVGRGRMIGGTINAQFAHLHQQLLSGASNRLHRRVTLMVEAAIGQNLRIGGCTAQKTVFLHQRHTRAGLGRTNGSTYATGTATGDDDVIIVLFLRHQFLQLRKVFSSRVINQLTISPRTARIATPAIS